MLVTKENSTEIIKSFSHNLFTETNILHKIMKLWAGDYFEKQGYKITFDFDLLSPKSRRPGRYHVPIGKRPHCDLLIERTTSKTVVEVDVFYNMFSILDKLIRRQHLLQINKCGFNKEWILVLPEIVYIGSLHYLPDLDIELLKLLPKLAKKCCCTILVAPFHNPSPVDSKPTAFDLNEIMNSVRSPIITKNLLR